MAATTEGREELELLLKSGYKLIFLCTQEEERAEAELKRIAKARGRGGEYFAWTETDGLVGESEAPSEQSARTRSPVAALQWIMERAARAPQSRSLHVLKDIHPYLSARTGQSAVVRKLRDAVHVLSGTHAALVLLGGGNLEMPPELEKEIVIVDFALPSFGLIRDTLRRIVEDYRAVPEVVIDLDDETLAAMAKAAQGLTLTEAELAINKALVRDKRLDRSDIALIADEKKQIIRKTGILTCEEPGRMDEVGGLENLKAWLGKRRDIRTERAAAFGLPEPKGVMLTGIPGCGKSLCAKAMASFWSIPLLRLDMGAVFAGLVGSSEANMRKAIQCAEAMAPCILMIDEIEKGLGGLGAGGGGDGGTSTRVFGTLLSWMNDKTCSVFVVATANDFARLPPEMLRKGRFDEIFFVDFPHAGERENIFRIHLAKRGRAPERFDLLRLVEASENYTGSEIEQAIVAGMIEAFARGATRESGDVGTADILVGIANTIPLFDTMREKISQLRERANQCTVSASKNFNAAGLEPAKGAPARGGRRVDL